MRMINNVMNRRLPRSTKGRRPLAVCMCVLLLTSSGAAFGHKATKWVSGTYDLYFTQTGAPGDLAGDHIYVNAELEGGFALNIGGEEHRGRLIWPAIAKIPTSPDGLLSIFGGSLWIFDLTGVICSGYHGVREGSFPAATRARLQCSDGTKLRLTLTDTEVEPMVSTEGVIKGVLQKRHPRDDDDHHDD